MSAAHSGDHAIYPDCRPVFVNAMETALHLCDRPTFTFHAPYLHLTRKSQQTRVASFVPLVKSLDGFKKLPGLQVYPAVGVVVAAF